MRGRWLAVTVAPPDEDLAVLAEVQRVLIEVLESRNGELGERNSQLEGRVAELEERLARLERLLSRNSGNSGMPPSADDLPGKTAPARSRSAGTGEKGNRTPAAPGR